MEVFGRGCCLGGLLGLGYAQPIFFFVIGCFIYIYGWGLEFIDDNGR